MSRDRGTGCRGEVTMPTSLPPTDPMSGDKIFLVDSLEIEKY